MSRQEWSLDQDTAKFLADMITAGDEPAEITLRVGFIRDDDGSVKHGLLVYESEYPEEGASILAESPEPAESQELDQLRAENASLKEVISLAEDSRLMDEYLKLERANARQAERIAELEQGVG